MKPINGGQSALIHMGYAVQEPRMSADALRIVRVASHLRMCLQSPERSAWFDHHVFEVDTLLRGYATDYITQATTDLDFHAFLSREAAAGRRFSRALPRGGFCQAGVVAPPDSLMCETNASTGRR
ncbi:hypothetical protein [[Acidovorax] ebreus]|uniref:Uncharacterized protein n=1 Tax=Acidovorax ebreus (strain TPSY) TaxID=535289 RepID=A0A9J9QF24_ACIET|nr:hypothetical protein [[Acidovorax] ebreus]ACM32315.1 hypothetical protein Dtpsy_0837 [[Acidovorax] ebreus TPSY]